MTNGLTRTAFLLQASFLLVGCSDTSDTLPVSSLVDSSTTDSAAVESQASEHASSETPAVKVAQQTDVESKALQPVGADEVQGVPPRYTVHKKVIPPPQPVVPPVLLSGAHKKLCKVNVGGMMPSVSLPRLDGVTTDLNSMLGKQGTVVLFWHPDRWMARTALIDMQRDIAEQFDAKQVSVVGVAVQQTRGSVQASLNKAQASFPQLLDTDGLAFASVGTVALPRIYVLDPAGKIVWFDIEYSEGTRRELWQTLRVLTAE